MIRLSGLPGLLLALLLGACGADGGPSLLSSGQLQFSVAVLDFGTVAVGGQASATITLKDTGSVALSLTDITASALGLAAPFSLATTGTCKSASTLTTGQSCTIVVTYAPSAAGTQSLAAAFLFQSGGASYSASLPIQGVALPPGRISFADGAAYSFGSVNEFSSATHAEQVTNDGGLPLTFGTISAAAQGLAAPFGIGGGTCASGFSLGAGATCTINFTFAPTAAGTVPSQAARMAFTSNGASGQATIGLQGSEVPIGTLTIAPSPFVFARATVNTTTLQTFTLANSGGQPLALGSMTSAGVGLAAPFSVSGGTCSSAATLRPASSCTLIVAFAPVVAGSYAQTLQASADSAGRLTVGSAALSATAYDFIPLTSGEAAGTVIGQPDFTSTGSSATQSTLNFPTGVDVAADGSLRILDYANNRVLGYNAVPPNGTVGPLADFVIFQTNFTATSNTYLSSTYPESSSGTTWAIGNDVPYGISAVIDLYTPLPTTATPPAPVLVGDGTTNCSRSGLLGPEGVFLGAGMLLIGDSNRILIWNSIPTTSGVLPDLVLGQPDFTTCVNGSTTASTVQGPYGVWTDGTRLVVVDQSTNRVLIWNAFPTTNGQPADLVLGQPDMVSGAANNTPNAPGTVSAQGLNQPWGVASNGYQLFLADFNNNRVLVWNSFPTSNQQAADLVLGQANFTSNASAAGANGLSLPAAVFVVGSSQVLVADTLNSRVLVWYHP
jgi:hypothetical protein